MQIFSGDDLKRQRLRNTNREAASTKRRAAAADEAAVSVEKN